nr:radical SAM protein [candidate division Zixibacteria bacterium]
MSDFEFIPRAVVWEITFACNMNCIHCGTAAGKKRENELTTEEAMHLIDELADLGATQITLSGGEPMLRKDWRELARKVKSRGVQCLLITNGYIVTQEIVNDFAALKIDRVGVSLDGMQETHDKIRRRKNSWERAINALKMICDNGTIAHTAVSSISTLNFHELDQIRDKLLEIGCKRWRIQMVTGTGRMQESKNEVMTVEMLPRFIDKLIEYKKDNRIHISVGENIGYFGCRGTELWDDMPYFGCFAGTRIAGVESDGTVKGCLSMPEDFVEGNIRDSSFKDIWNNPEGFAYNRQFTRETADGECHDCRYLPLCRGGCTTTSFAATGSRANNPYCIYRIEKKQGIKPRETQLIRDILADFEPVEAAAD